MRLNDRLPVLVVWRIVAEERSENGGCSSSIIGVGGAGECDFVNQSISLSVIAMRSVRVPSDILTIRGRGRRKRADPHYAYRRTSDQPS